MRKILAACIALMFPALGQAQDADLRGQWKITSPARPTYSGEVLIDAERRAIWDAREDNGRPAKYQGYIAGLDGPRVEIILTDRAGVAHVHCTIQSSDLLACYVARGDGVISVGFALTRIGPGPSKLKPILPSRG